MPARKTTEATTKKTTTTRKTATRKTTPRKTTTRKTTAKPQAPTIDTETLKAQFQEMGGLIKEDGDRLTISFEDRYTTLQPTDLDQWIQDNLTDLEGVYERGEQKEWINKTFPESIVKSIENQPTQETEEPTQSTETEALKETAHQDAIAIVELLNTPENTLLSEEILKKVEKLRGKSLSREGLTKYFDIQVDTEDDMELCSQLSSLGVSIQITNTRGAKRYTVT